jgi:hypothetical protein
MSRIATIHATPGLNATPVYVIEYTKDGQPAGRSYARAADLEEWKTDLTADGWTVTDTTQQ